MQNPTVSFIVPCYKLAHLLPECVNSILSQTYRDFEVLIMDDCSPDNTPQVARAFGDPRVKHIRNDPNLGHLRNYNRGIELSRGKYVWLISADDLLRKPYVLQQYVGLMDSHPRVGYTFCAGVGMVNGRESKVLDYSAYRDRDQVVRGRVLLKELLRKNLVLSAAGMARRECYEKISVFPLDMPWAGDWYLWSLFALYYDVGFFAEPMVCYREHELSMTNILTQKSAGDCCAENVAVPWAIKRKADDRGLQGVSRAALSALAEIYARNIATKRFGMASPSLTLEQFEESLLKNTGRENERTFVRARTYAAMGNEYYWRGEMPSAKKFYGLALSKDPWMAKVAFKRLLLGLGNAGVFLRKRLGAAI